MYLEFTDYRYKQRNTSVENVAAFKNLAFQVRLAVDAFHKKIGPVAEGNIKS